MPAHPLAAFLLAAGLCAAGLLAAPPARADQSFFEQAAPSAGDDAQLEAAAAKGNPDAQYLFGSILMARAEKEGRSGWSTQARMIYRQALRWMREAAQRDHPKAMFAVGYLDLEGQAGAKDPREAKRWLDEAVRRNTPEAQYLVGLLLIKGEAPYGRDPQRGMDLVSQAGVGFLRENRLSWVEQVAQTVDRLSPGNSYSARLREEAAKPGRQAVQDGLSTGAGFVVAGGYVATNFHVVEGKSKLSLALSGGRMVPARVAAEDRAHDLALLAVEDPCALPPALPLAEAEPGLGAEVFTIGFPMVGVLGSSPKLSAGLVQGLSEVRGEPMLQVGAVIQHGNSGGPLLNLRGEAVGVVTLKLDSGAAYRASGEMADKIGFAIRAQRLRELLARAPKQSKGLLGSLKGLISGPCPAEAPASPGTLEQAAGRVQGSVLMVVGE